MFHMLKCNQANNTQQSSWNTVQNDLPQVCVEFVASLNSMKHVQLVMIW